MPRYYPGHKSRKARIAFAAPIITNLSSFVERSRLPSVRLVCHHGRDVPTEAAVAKQRAAQAKDPSIRIAHEAAFWLLLAEQMDWIDKGRSIPSATKGVSLSLYRHSWEYNSTLIGSSSIRTGRRWLRDSHVPACERMQSGARGMVAAFPRPIPPRKRRRRHADGNPL